MSTKRFEWRPHMEKKLPLIVCLYDEELILVSIQSASSEHDLSTMSRDLWAEMRTELNFFFFLGVHHSFGKD